MKKEHPNTSSPSSNTDSLFNQMANISKAHAYDIVSKQIDELMEENKRLKELEHTFYMDICRAYNAGKQSMNAQHEAAKNGDPGGHTQFKSSHEYFVTEFPEFTVNVP